MLPDCHIEGVTRLVDVCDYKSQMLAVTKASCLQLQKPGVCGYKSQVFAVTKARCLRLQKPGVCGYKSQVFAVTKARCLWLQKPDVCVYKSQKQDVCGRKAIKYNKMQMTFVVMEAFEGVHDTEVIVHME